MVFTFCPKFKAIVDMLHPVYGGTPRFAANFDINPLLLHLICNDAINFKINNPYILIFLFDKYQYIVVIYDSIEWKTTYCGFFCGF